MHHAWLIQGAKGALSRRAKLVGCQPRAQRLFYSLRFVVQCGGDAADAAQHAAEALASNGRSCSAGVNSCMSSSCSVGINGRTSRSCGPTASSARRDANCMIPRLVSNHSRPASHLSNVNSFGNAYQCATRTRGCLLVCTFPERA